MVLPAGKGNFGRILLVIPRKGMATNLLVHNLPAPFDQLIASSGITATYKTYEKR